jgi:solute:Na+ symporter, SSS family
MQALDYAALIGLMVWMLVIGAVFSRRMKNESEMFTAGGRSPWWISGLSGFMTIFSAGTFVVWGGIAFRLGLVAVSILMTIGTSVVVVGFAVAARWRRMSIATPTQFLRIRYSEPVVQAYTWIGMFYGGIAMAVGLYSLAVMLAALVPLPEGVPWRDPQTGNLAVSWSIILWGAIVIAYTMAGGLWAVLMTDVIQCIILCLVVLVAVPLSIGAVGGVGELWRRAPEGFFAPTAGEYSYTFLFLWFWVGFFRYAAEWAFVQRYICVPTAKDARKAALLMGGLYLVSPMVWMLPAMAFRILDPGVRQEEAYVLICRKVLPTGMLGVMVAAMFSATASTVSGLLNVFAGVFTCDVYKALIHPLASPRRMVLVGRLATLIYGSTVIVGALLVPRLGGAERMVITLVTVLATPLALPVVWGLYSRHVGQAAVWITLAISTPLAILVKIASASLSAAQLRSLSPWLAAGIAWIQTHPHETEAILGMIVPVAILTAIEVVSRRRGIDPGWRRMQACFADYEERPRAAVASRLPAVIVGVSLVAIGLFMAVVAITAAQQRFTLAVFAALLLAAAAATLGFGLRTPRRP